MNSLLVRKFLIPVHDRLLGRRTTAYARNLEISQWWPVERLKALQLEKLRRLIAHAERSCPHYSDSIRAAGILPDTLTLADLARLPTLTKDDIRANRNRLIESPLRRTLFDYTTGGSSGDPLAFKIDRSRQAADQGARARSRRWYEIELGQRELYLWGSPVELRVQDRIKSMRDRLTNQLLLSAFEMTPERMNHYLDQWWRFDPVHVFGYPSSLSRLLQHSDEQARLMRTPSLKAAFVTGELLLEQDRELIEECLQVPVADGYGSREAGFIAHQCPQGRYHVTMESLIVELLDRWGAPVPIGESGEVTITHLDAFGMPFIRYRTGDFARQSVDSCPCGRGLETLDRIEGRRTDMLKTKDNGWAHALSVIYILREARGIRQFRVEQTENLDLAVSVVADASFDDQTRLAVIDGLQRRIGGDTTVSLQLVTHIPHTSAGKHRCVISHA